MTTLFDYTIWDTGPTIEIKAEYETKNRTGTTVDVHLKVYIRFKYSGGQFGYNIQMRPSFGSYTSDLITVKNNSPSTWSGDLVYDFGWHTTNASASLTSLGASIFVTSNSKFVDKTFTGTINFSKGNTSPYWPTGATVSLSHTGIVPENVSTITVTTSAAKDDQSNPITYRFRWYKDDETTAFRTQEKTSLTDSINWNQILGGQKVYCTVDIKDSLMSTYENPKNSNTITKNLLTGASIISISNPTYSSNSITFSRTSGNNSSGETQFTYNLFSEEIPIYNNIWPANQATLEVAIWRTGEYPGTPYIRFEDLKNAVSDSNYIKYVPFQILTTNEYDTSVYSAEKLTLVNLKQNPTAFNINTPGGLCELSFGDFYIPNIQDIVFSWEASVDPLGNIITYDVYISVDNGEWDFLQTTEDTHVNYSRSGDFESHLLRLRVIAKTVYGTQKESIQASGDAIVAHYYNPPTLDSFAIVREPLDWTIKWYLNANTSIENALHNATFTIKDTNNVTLLTFSETSTEGSSSFIIPKKTIVMDSETTTYTAVVSCTEIDASTLGINIESQSFVIPRYAAALTVREKGVGINAVAGNATNFMINANPFVQLSNNSYVGGYATHKIVFFDKVYYDAAGNIRASQTLSKNAQVTCFEWGSSGFRKGTTTTKAAALKDAVVSLNSWSYTVIA